MDPLLVAGIVLIVLFVGVPILQAGVRRRQAAVERRLPHVSELAGLVLTRPEYPEGFAVQYRGPVTNERLAWEAEDEEAAFAEIDATGRVMGYRQTFRDPRSFGELTDVLLNWTLRRQTAQREVVAEVVLYEDAQGAMEGVDEEVPPQPNVDDDGNALEVSAVDGHDLGFATSVREWVRRAPDGTALQRRLAVRWHDGRLGCFVTGDAEPADALDTELVLRTARLVHERAARSGLREPASTAV